MSATAGNPTLADIEILARTIWGEARGESDEGKRWVAHVILNRARGAVHAFDASIAQACLRPRQFSCWNPDDPNLAKLRALRLDDRDFQRCLAIALQAVAEDDPTGGCTHYHAVGLTPTWAIGVEPARVIGNHVFYRNLK